MPVTYTVPQAQPNVPTITDVELFATAETPQVLMRVHQNDANGNPLPVVPLSMTPAAFLAAVNAASGTFKNRIYVVALAQMGLTGVVS